MGESIWNQDDKNRIRKEIGIMIRRRKTIKNNDELRDEYLKAYDEIISKTFTDILTNILKVGLTDDNLRILNIFLNSKKDFKKRYC